MRVRVIRIERERALTQIDRAAPIAETALRAGLLEEDLDLSILGHDHGPPDTMMCHSGSSDSANTMSARYQPALMTAAEFFTVPP